MSQPGLRVVNKFCYGWRWPIEQTSKGCSPSSAGVWIGCFHPVFFLFKYLLICQVISIITGVQLRGQSVGADSLHLCVPRGLDSGHPTWWQAYLPTKPPHLPPISSLTKFTVIHNQSQFNPGEEFALLYGCLHRAGMRGVL